MSEALNFQTIILRLQAFWGEHGCLIWQPYHTEVGAGTMNPATSLRVLGPEPWNVAYVEPSIRPDDGRYGENPNRLYQHYQFQVILKPDPGNPQDLYLQSLIALGIDPRKHDIRFVEDNWESPIIGAWGLGWEVWLDGLEITQFTYFQQSGGVTLEPVSVELTYGLERIAMALQGVRDFRDIRWDDQRTYGDVNLQSEQEFSKYAFELADVEHLRQMFDLYEAEAEVCLAQEQVLPAHDYVLKCSQTFNLLDTRGAIGVTERAAYFHRMRKLSRAVAKAYLAQREALGYPWLPAQSQTAVSAPPPALEEASLPGEPAPFLLEIGTEELPHQDLNTALDQLGQALPAMLTDLRLDYADLRILGTPRRLVAYLEGLAPRQSDLEEVVKGPPASRAFDEQGKPTKAAEGFARSKGVRVEDLEVRQMDGGEYVVAVVHRTGEPAGRVLMDALPQLVAGLRFNKTMRWNETGVSFSRPIRWLVAMHGQAVVPFSYAGVTAGNTTYGLRFYQPEAISLETPAAYFDALAAQGILLDPEQRKQAIRAQVLALAEEVGGTVEDDPALLDEVTNLVEAPTALRGEFEAEYLSLPRYVLSAVMKKHQRYFPVEKDDALLPYFITVRNGDDQHLDLVRHGNADVIRARFADAAYFVREDMKHPLASFVPKLDKLTFQADLGSMLDKTNRLTQLVSALADALNLNAQEKAYAERAAYLCKADLATQMVVEMTSLQGLMGRDYARHSGEPEAVAQAIFEHYLPRSADDQLPQTKPGLVVGLADRLDSLVGLFAAGLAPSGNKDPFAQRRAALGLVANLVEWDIPLDLREAIAITAEFLPIACPPEAREACLTFIVERLRNVLLDNGYRYDIVEAVLRAQGHIPARAAKAVTQLAAWVERDDWHEILPAYARCVRITREFSQRFPLHPEKLTLPAEKALLEALESAERTPRSPGSADDMLNAFLPMIPAINRFFDDVLVMSEDPDERQNRLGLLQRIVALADGVADFSALEGF